MANRRVSAKPHIDELELTISLSWDEAEKLARLGPTIISVIKAVTETVKARKPEVREKTAKTTKSKATADANAERFYCFGREVDRKVRALAREARAAGSNLSPAGLRREALKALRGDYELSPNELALYAKLYRAKLKDRIQERRNQRIIRLHFLGMTHKEIGLKVGASAHSVGGFLRENKKLVASLRLSMRPFISSPSGLSLPPAEERGFHRAKISAGKGGA